MTSTNNSLTRYHLAGGLAKAKTQQGLLGKEVFKLFRTSGLGLGD
jgi:hypothetical protein